MLQIAYIVTERGIKRSLHELQIEKQREGRLALERRGVVWAGVVLVLVVLAYVVPYTLLAEVDRWYGSFLFWTVFGLAAIVVIWALTRSWRD
jgi:hypothetical protein